jgi:hypothetical protein
VNAKHKVGEKDTIGCAKQMHSLERTLAVGPTMSNRKVVNQGLQVQRTVSHLYNLRKVVLGGSEQHKLSTQDVSKVGYRLCAIHCTPSHGHFDQIAGRQASQSTPNSPTEGNIPMVDLQSGTSTQNDVDEQEYADELRFYIRQIYLVIQPVVICIILSIFWVKVAYSGTSDYTPVSPSYSIGVSSSSSSDTSSSSSSSVVSSLTTALLIVGQIIVVTVVIVFLFRKGWIKVSAVLYGR